MIGMQRCLFRSIRKNISSRLCRSISKIPTDKKKVKNPKCIENAEKSKKETDPDNSNRTEFNSYDCFLPDRKGDVQVCIIGGGEAPIYTAVLLKQSRLIKRVNLVDTTDSMASAILDINHIDTSTQIKYYKRKHLKNALKETNIIALMDEADTNVMDLNPRTRFEAASSYVYEMAEQMVTVSADALVAVFVRPVTAMLPMVSEIYKLAGWWDPDRIVGSTSLERMRMEATTANLLDLNPAFLSVPMVAGADPYTIVPLLSRASPINRFTYAQQEMLLQSLRGADKEMARIEAKGPVLSVGAAAAKLILALAGGLTGSPNVISSGYVRSNVLPVCRFFTTELQLGPGGVQKNYGLPKMSPAELVLVEQAIPIINEHIHMAMKAVSSCSHVKRKSL
ncbi:PREDICTED: probable malate dehydrogenase, mitochondrial [Dufourea novaeangliae]|uniref:probable malate dehydrogenase, mitochondrial n=1 Tax=Dufourea novaeangliae TaxID=178035 RepID=UPI0007675ED8|nr:PREDICTED: probable malate dehydrogenase, mitochondrial [Dufourea novaeangliae]